MNEQFPLDLAPEPVFTFDNFVSGQSNQDVLQAIQAFPDWPMPVLIVSGPAGCGKTHLGNAWVIANENVVFVDEASTKTDLELFTAINQGLNGELRGVLLADQSHPDNWQIELKDLRSRLNNIPKLSLADPGDDILESVIRKLFEDRGRNIKSDIVSYILLHYERSVTAITRLVEDVEKQARAQKKDVTKSFVVSVLKRAGNL